MYFFMFIRCNMTKYRNFTSKKNKKTDKMSKKRMKKKRKKDKIP